MSIEPRSPGLGRISRPICFATPAILFLCGATFLPTVSRAQGQQDQGVAEAARQEHARKQESQKRAKHVYTEEDLKHPNILTPEDRAQIEARRNECAQKNICSPALTQNAPASLDANSETPQVPLGDVARRVRKQKELQALKPRQSEAFHLPFATPALASPIVPERPAIRPPAQAVLRPKTPSNVLRRDPFSAVPLRPELRRAEIQPRVREKIRPDVREDIQAFSLESIFAKAVAPAATVRPSKLQSVLRPATTAMRKTVSVQSGDSLWKLAEDNLGGGKRWPELLAANPNIVNPNRIGAGAQLNLPYAVAVTPNAAGKDRNRTASTIRVRKGDTLWALARTNLGRASAWHCLAAANPSISDPQRIYENQELIVPTACTP